MQNIREALTDTLEDNEHLMLVFKNIVGSFFVGLFIEYITGIGQSSYHGALIIAVMFINAMGIMLKASSELAEEKRMDIDSAYLEADKSTKVAQIAIGKYNEAKEAYTTLKSEVGELQAGHDQLAKECEHLRKSERSYIEKLQAQADDLMTTEKEMILTAEKFATMKKELMTAKDNLMTAEKELMTVKSERNKLKTSPLLKLGEMCLDYRNLRSLGATNGVNRDNEAKRAEYSQKAKDLNASINKHIESL